MRKLILLLFCIICLAGCADKTAIAIRDMTERFSVLQSGDTRNFINTAAVEYDNTTLFNFWDAGDFRNIFYGMSYSILETNEVDLNTITVNMNVTAVDFAGLKALTYAELYNEAIEKYEALDIEAAAEDLPDTVGNMAESLIGLVQTWTEEDVRQIIDDELIPKADESAKKALIDAGISQVNNRMYEKLKKGEQVPFRTVNLDVRIKKNDNGVWQICIDEPLYKALVGYSDLENYEVVETPDSAKLRAPVHSWSMKAAAVNPGTLLTHWTPSVSFYFNVSLAAVLLIVCLYYILSKKGRGM